MELGTAKVLVQIKRTTDSLEAERKDSVPILSPVLLRGVAEVVDEDWLEDRPNVAGEVLPFPDRAFLTQHMRSDEEGGHTGEIRWMMPSKDARSASIDFSGDIAPNPTQNSRSS